MPKHTESAFTLLCLIFLLLCEASQQANSPRYQDLGVCTWSRYGSRFPLQAGLDTCPTPLNQNKSPEQGDWAPWSHRPYCIRPAHRHYRSQEYCLFTSSSFRGNHGISIITTPELAASIANNLDDSCVPENDRNHPSSRMDPKNQTHLSFDVEDLPGRGKGVVARRNIQKWDIVMVGWPSIMLPVEYQEYFSIHQRRALLGRAVKQLPEDQQAEILSLARSTGGELIEDILKTNIFGIDINGISYMGLIPEGSRVNHNCRPNVFWRYSPRSMTMEVIAMRDIMAGEEISHSYVSLGRTLEERKYVLSEWGFNCSCWLCTAPPEQVKESDQRRERVYDIHAKLAEIYEGESEYVPDEDSIAALAEELFALVEKEQLWPQMVVFYEVVARAYMEIAEWETAKKYIALSEDRWIQYGGQDHDNVDGIRELWAEFKQRASSQ